MWSEIENKGKSKEKIRFGKGLPKWLSHRSTEVYRNSDPAEVPNRTEDFGRPLEKTQRPEVSRVSYAEKEAARELNLQFL